MEILIHRIPKLNLNKAEKYAFISALLCGLFLYNKWITELIINPDVLLNGIVYKYGMQWEDSLGRIGLKPVAYMKGLFVLPGFTALICIILNAAVASILCRIFEVKKEFVAAGIGLLLCCSPSFCEMMTYYYCSDAYMWACICSVLFVFFTGRKEQFRFCVFGVVILAISLSLYQAYLGTAISLSVYYLLFLVLIKKKEFKALVISICKMCVSGISGILLYLGVFSLHCIVSGRSANDRIGKMGSFPLNNLVSLIKQSYGAFYEYYVGNAKFHHVFMGWGRINLLLIAFLYIVILWRLISEKGISVKVRLLGILLSLIIPLCVMSVCLYANSVSIYGVTGILMVPHINYIYIFLLILLFGKTAQNRMPDYLFNVIGVILTISISFVLILYTQAYAASVEQDFNQADTVANIMVNKLSELPEFQPGMKLAIFGDYREGNFPRCGSGSWEPTELEDIVKGTGVEWGCFWPDEGGREGCWLSFLAYYKGCWFTEIEDGAEMAEIKKTKAFENMSVFPHEGSVMTIGDTAVVKLSD